MGVCSGTETVEEITLSLVRVSQGVELAPGVSVSAEPVGTTGILLVGTAGVVSPGMEMVEEITLSLVRVSQGVEVSLGDSVGSTPVGTPPVEVGPEGTEGVEVAGIAGVLEGRPGVLLEVEPPQHFAQPVSHPMMISWIVCSISIPQPPLTRATS